MGGMPSAKVPVMLPELVTLARPVYGVNSDLAAGDAGAGIVGHRRVGIGENAVDGGAGDAAGISDVGRAALAKIPDAPPVMMAPALLVTVALVPAKMPSQEVPVMLPELVTLARPVLAKIPDVPPVMVAPALLVTVTLILAEMPSRAVPVMLPELVTSEEPVKA